MSAARWIALAVVAALASPAGAEAPEPLHHDLRVDASITGAAQRSGFSDAAHLTRTLRRMLGMTPGELIRRRAPVRASFVSLD